MPILTRIDGIGQSARSPLGPVALSLFIHGSSISHLKLATLISDLSDSVWFAPGCVIDHQFFKKSGNSDSLWCKTVYGWIGVSMLYPLRTFIVPEM